MAETVLSLIVIVAPAKGSLVRLSVTRPLTELLVCASNARLKAFRIAKNASFLMVVRFGSTTNQWLCNFKKLLR